MFRPERSKSTIVSAFTLAELIFHSTVRSIRKTHGHAVIGLLINMMQTAMLVVTFYVMFDVLGLRGSSVRGDFLLYLMSGIFMFMTHTKSMGAVFGSEGPTSAMMKHAPMTTAISIGSAALGALYIQLLSIAVVLSLILCLNSGALMRLFVQDAGMIATGAQMLRWQVYTAAFGGVVLLLTVLFQATGKIVPSFLLSISRQGVVFLLALVVCVHLFQYQGVLMAQAVADILSAALALGLLAASRDIIAKQ